MYKTYRDKRPQGFSHADTPFYLAATTVANPGSRHPWFARAPVGINKLKNTMKRMIENANIQTDRRLTNTSVRKHLCQNCWKTIYPTLTLYKSLAIKKANSLNNYRQISNAQKHDISSLLADTNACAPTTNTLHTDFRMQNNTSSVNQSEKSIFYGSVIHGGTFNISINYNVRP